MTEKAPRHVYLPAELRDRVEKIRCPGPDGKPAFSEFAVALLANAVDSYEESYGNLQWEEGYRFVVDPTLKQDEARIVASDGSINKVVQLDAKIDDNGVVQEVLATDLEDGIRFRILMDPTTGNCRVEQCDASPSTDTTTSSESTTDSNPPPETDASDARNL